MKTIKKIFTVLFILFIGWIINLIWYKPFSIDLFYERTFLENCLEKPEQLTEYHLLENYGFHAHNARLNDISENHKMKALETIIKQYDMLLTYSRFDQTKEQLRSTNVLSFYLQDLIFSQEFSLHPYSINHIDGTHLQLPLLLVQAQQINNLKDANNYLLRLTIANKKFHQLCESLLLKEELDKIPPKVIIDKMIAQINTLLEDDIRNEIIYKDFQTKIHSIKNISDDAIREFTYEVKLELENGTREGYLSLKEQLENSRERASETAGIGRYDDGMAYYTYLLNKHNTIENVAYDSLISLAEKEITVLRTELQPLLISLGYDIPESLEVMMNEIYEENMLPNTKMSQLKILSNFRKTTSEIRKETHSLFYFVPIKKMKLQKMSSALSPHFGYTYYYAGSIDESRNPTLFLNLNHTKELPHFLIPALVTKNLLGNYIQDVTQKRHSNIPTFRKQIQFTAYKKGWEYYSLKLAYKKGFFKTPLHKIGALQFLLLQNAMLIADIKMHTQNLSRQDAIKMVHQQTGFPYRIAEAAIDESIMKPAQACAFILGYQKIIDLKKRAKKSLKAETFEKDFHKKILEQGQLPLKILEKVIE